MSEKLTEYTLEEYIVMWRPVPVPSKNFPQCNAPNVSAIKLNHDGSVITVGFVDGCISLYERILEDGDVCKLHFLGSFRSHCKAFDTLTSTYIREGIRSICFLKPPYESPLFLCCNDRTLKLWKVSIFDRTYDSGEIYDTANNTIHFPKTRKCAKKFKPYLKNTFADVHQFQLNSLSVSSDCETFISADDLDINLWNFSHNKYYRVFTPRSAKSGSYSEVIATAEFHPINSNQIALGTSSGRIYICDVREDNSRKDKLKTMLSLNSDYGAAMDIMSNVTHVAHSHSGNYLLYRDYVSLKVWDLRMESRPFLNDRDDIVSYFLNKFSDLDVSYLYENDLIFDKFTCCWSPNDDRILTGSYNNTFSIFELSNSSHNMYYYGGRDNIPTRSETFMENCVSKRDKRPWFSTSSVCAWDPFKDIIMLGCGESLLVYSFL